MNPRLGIFLARDPWSGDRMQPGTMNGFSYASANPINRIDPSGKIDLFAWTAALNDWPFESSNPCPIILDIQPYKDLGILLGETLDERRGWNPTSDKSHNENLRKIIKGTDLFTKRIKSNLVLQRGFHYYETFDFFGPVSG